MGDKPIEQIRQEMEARSTSELRRIWETEYRHKWTDAEFEMVGKVLRERGEIVEEKPVQTQNEAIEPHKAARKATPKAKVYRQVKQKATKHTYA